MVATPNFIFGSLSRCDFGCDNLVNLNSKTKRSHKQGYHTLASTIKNNKAITHTCFNKQK